MCGFPPKLARLVRVVMRSSRSVPVRSTKKFASRTCFPNSLRNTTLKLSSWTMSRQIACKTILLVSRLCGAGKFVYSFKENREAAFQLLPEVLGGADRDRTADLLNAIQTRSQLRHGPKRS